jgi:hypothetical protein
LLLVVQVEFAIVKALRECKNGFCNCNTWTEHVEGCFGSASCWTKHTDWYQASQLWIKQ